MNLKSQEAMEMSSSRLSLLARSTPEIPLLNLEDAAPQNGSEVSRQVR